MKSAIKIFFFTVLIAFAIIFLNIAGHLSVVEKAFLPAENERGGEKSAYDSVSGGFSDENNSGTAPFSLPINLALDRVSKKPFGIEVSPSNSPVNPERFSGYHTGVDFEIFEEEKDVDVQIFAVCQGALIVKQQVSGYGGAVVQKCLFENQDITVVYGHLKLSSVKAEVGKEIFAGEEIGILGKGFSSETDGERKHLHLGIHRGGKIEFRGYVQNQKELEGWIDVMKYLK